MAQLDKTFPTLDCAACILTPKMVEAAQNEKIKIYAYSEVEAVKGFVGNFTCDHPQKGAVCERGRLHWLRSLHREVSRRKRSRTILTWASTPAAPSTSRLRRPCRRSPPSTQTTASMLKTGKCGVCSKVCTAGAIDYKQQDDARRAASTARSWSPPALTPSSSTSSTSLRYSQSPDVVTSLWNLSA